MAFQIHIGPRSDDIELRQAKVIKAIGIRLKSKCANIGWDDEEKKAEVCGAIFSNTGCQCHPTYCPNCSAETHGISLYMPSLVEHSPIDCSSKGNY